MSKFEPGQIVYRACIADFEGGEHAIVILAAVETVRLRANGPPTYHLRNFDGLRRPGGAVWKTFDAAEDSLFTNPVEAMHRAAAAASPGARRTVDNCAEGVAHA